MNPDDWLKIAQLGGTASTIIVLGLGVMAFLRGWIHTDKEMTALRDDRDQWKNMALWGGQTALNAANIAAGQGALLRQTAAKRTRRAKARTP